MARKKCLDCPAIIASGSRCKACARKYRSPYSRHQWAQAVKRRDGWRCAVCGAREDLEAHHLVAKADGGDDSLANGITLCRGCHDDHHAGRLPHLPAPRVAPPADLAGYLAGEAVGLDELIGVDPATLRLGE